MTYIGEGPFFSSGTTSNLAAGDLLIQLNTALASLNVKNRVGVLPCRRYHWHLILLPHSPAHRNAVYKQVLSTLWVTTSGKVRRPSSIFFQHLLLMAMSVLCFWWQYLFLAFDGNIRSLLLAFDGNVRVAALIHYSGSSQPLRFLVEIVQLPSTDLRGWGGGVQFISPYCLAFKKTQYSRIQPKDCFLDAPRIAFRRVSGTVWLYKSTCEKVLNLLNLS